MVEIKFLNYNKCGIYKICIKYKHNINYILLIKLLLDLIQFIEMDATHKRFNAINCKHMERILNLIVTKETMNSHMDLKMTILKNCVKGVGKMAFLKNVNFK